MSYFFIRSRLNGLVLDIEGGNRAPGARVLLWNQKPVDNDNQLWYDDHQTGTIRSKLNGFCLDLAGLVYTLMLIILDLSLVLTSISAIRDGIPRSSQVPGSFTYKNFYKEQKLQNNSIVLGEHIA
jgi:Ricin-type beta-trefoil lectin domain-like